MTDRERREAKYWIEHLKSSDHAQQKRQDRRDIAKGELATGGRSGKARGLPAAVVEATLDTSMGHDPFDGR